VGGEGYFTGGPQRVALIVDVTAGHGLSHGIAAAAAAQVEQAGGRARSQ